VVTEQRRGGIGRAGRGAPTGLRAALTAIEADAAGAGIGPALSRGLCWLPVAGTVLLGVIYAARSRSYYWILLEDHPVEWGQFAFLAFAVLAAGVAAARLARQGRYGLAALLVLVALGSLVLAGEEISWGERVFSLAPPADVASINKQHELNLHNLTLDGVSVDIVSELLELAMGLGGAAVCLLARPRRGPLHRTWVWQVAPPLAAVPVFAVMALYQAVMLSARITAAPAILYQEWMEFGFYLGIAVTVAAVWARAAGGPAAGRRPLVVAALLALAVTGVFALLSARSAVLPGNVPPSLVGLYGSF